MISYVSLSQAAKFLNRSHECLKTYCRKGEYFEHAVQNGQRAKWYVKAEVNEAGTVTGIYSKDFGLIGVKGEE